MNTSEQQVYCPRCGGINVRDAQFCVHCGQRFIVSLGESQPDKQKEKEVSYSKWASGYQKGKYKFHWALYILEITLMLVAVGIMIYLSAVVYQYDSGKAGAGSRTDSIIICAILVSLSVIFGFLATKKDKRLSALLFAATTIIFGAVLSDGNDLIVWTMPIIPVAWLLVKFALAFQYDAFVKRTNNLDIIGEGNNQAQEGDANSIQNKMAKSGNSKTMYIVGAVLIALGIIVTIWANNYRPSLEEVANSVIEGEKNQTVETAKQMKTIGPIVIVVGAAVVVYVLFMQKPWQGITFKDSRIEEKTVIEQLKEYKELLDAGIVTQEEFDRKKNEMLRL